VRTRLSSDVRGRQAPWPSGDPVAPAPGADFFLVARNWLRDKQWFEMSRSFAAARVIGGRAMPVEGGIDGTPEDMRVDNAVVVYGLVGAGGAATQLCRWTREIRLGAGSPRTG
jgi:hypothetical protein